jgi:endonuclease/exonuclease/phosphatase family metal-dependent hydrolase
VAAVTSGAKKVTAWQEEPMHPATLQAATTRRIILLVVGGLAVVGVNVWVGSWRLPVGTAAGKNLWTAARLRPTRTSDNFRVATWNIHSGRGRDGVVDLDRVARCIAGYDFVGLNEVRAVSGWGGPDQAERLGRSVNCAWLFLPYDHRWGRDDFGNAALSAFPVADWLRLPLPHSRPKGHGNMTLFKLNVSGSPVQIIVTHIDHRFDTTTQLQAVSSLFLGLSEPVILMGDLNVSADDPRLAELLGTRGVFDALAAAPEKPPAGRIDWILVRGLECTSAGVVDHGESDHPLVWAELRLPAPAASDGTPVLPSAAVDSRARAGTR